MVSSATFQPAAHTATFSSDDSGVSVKVTTMVEVTPTATTNVQSTTTPVSTTSTTPTTTPVLKPGYKTSEFWVTMVAQVVGLLTAMGVVSPAHTSDLSMAINTVIGALLALLPAMAYIFNRTWLKTKS